MTETARRRIDPAGVAFGVGFPVLAAAVTIALTGLWHDRLPERIADHWSGGGGPDGFSSPWTNAWTIAVLIVVVGAATGAIAAVGTAQLMMRRIMLVVSCLVTGLIATVDIVLLASQLDLADPSDARLQAWSIGVGVAVGLVVGIPAAALLRDHRVQVAATEPPDPALPRAASLTLPLVTSVGISRRVAAAVYGFLAVVAAVTCVLAHSAWPLPLFVAAGLLTAAVSRYTVVLDDDGLTVRCLGAPVLGYGSAEFTQATIREVHPFAEFGGWGLRMRRTRRYGVVTRRGPAFILEVAAGDTLAVTTDEAERFASAINTLADARHP